MPRFRPSCTIQKCIPFLVSFRGTGRNRKNGCLTGNLNTKPQAQLRIGDHSDMHNMPDVQSTETYAIKQLQAILQLVQLESHGQPTDVFKARPRVELLPHPSSAPRKWHYRPITEVRFTEPCIELIQRQLESLLRRWEILDEDHRPVPIHGFRLRRPEQWRYRVQSIMDNLGSPSSGCNVKCVFCYIAGNPWHIPQPPMTVAEVKTRLRNIDPRTQTGLFQTHQEYLEPFCNPNWLTILEEVRARFPREPLSTITNGSLIDEAAVERLARLKPVIVTISLNSSQTKVRSRLMRDHRPTRVLKAMTAFRAHQIAYSGSIVAWPTLPLDDLETTIRYLDQHEVRNIRIVLPGYTRYQPGVPEADFEAHWEKVVEFVKRMRLEVNTPIILQPNLYWQRRLDAYVSGVVLRSPAWAVGVKVGDVILAVNDTPTPYLADALRELANPTISLAGNRRRIEIDRDGQRLMVTVADDSDAADDLFPYKPVGYRTEDLGYARYFGVQFVETFEFAWLARLAKVILSHAATRPLIVSSRLVLPVLREALRLAGPGYLRGRRPEVIAGQNAYWGGNVILGDLMMVDDYRRTIEAYLRESPIRPDLIVIPGSFLLGWQRDFCGVPFAHLQRYFDVPIALVPCTPIGT